MYSHLVTRIFRSCSDGSVALFISCVQCTILCVQYSHLVTVLPVFLGPALMGVWPCSHPVYSVQYCVYSIPTLLPAFLGPVLMGVALITSCVQCTILCVQYVFSPCYPYF